MTAQVMRRAAQQPEMVRAFDLQPIHPDVLFAEMLRIGRVTSDHCGLVDVRTAIAWVQPEDWKQLKQVEVLGQRDFLPRRLAATVDRHRKFSPASRKLETLLPERRVLG